MKKSLVALTRATSVVLLTALFGLACEGVLPTNPYDPSAPPLEQAKGQVEGSILLDDPGAYNSIIEAELNAISVTISTLSGDDLATYSCADSANFVCDAGTRSGHFIFRDVSAGDYIVRIDGVNARYVPISLPRLALAPGERYDFGTLRYVVLNVDISPSGSNQHFSGVVDGLANLNAGSGAGRTMKLLRKTGQGLQAFMTVLSDDNGHFRFENLPPGTYGLSAELEDYTPDYRAGFEIPAQPVDGASLSIVHFEADPESVPVDEHTASNTALRLNRVTAVLIPAIQQTFGHYYTNADEVPVQVLQFGGMNQMRLSANENFCLDSVEDGGVVEDAGDCQNQVPWQQYSASAVVSLPDVEGEIPIYAQFKNTQVPGFTFVSSVYQTQVTRDVTPPRIEAVSIRGRSPAADGKIWFNSEAPLLSIDVDASDANSAVYSMALYHDADNAPPADPADLSFVLNESPAGLVRLNTEQGLTAGEGLKRVYVYLKDRAGNISEAAQLDAYVDATAPEMLSLRLDDGAVTTGTGLVRVNLAVSDSGSHVVAMKLWEEGAQEPADFSVFNSATVFQLASMTYNHVERQINAKLQDLAGNVSTQSSATIRFDDRGSLSGTLYVEATTDGTPGDANGLTALVNGHSYTPVTTDNGDGSFHFVVSQIPAASNLLLQLYKDGYGLERAADLYTVLPGGDSNVGSISLRLARGTIQGYVLLQGESDSSGIIVSVQGTDKVALTNSTGFFSLEDVTSNVSYTLVFRRDDSWSVVEVNDVTAPVSDVLQLNAASNPYFLQPLSGGFAIAEGAFTSSTTLHLLLSYDAATEYRAGESADLSDGVWANYSPSVESYAYTLQNVSEGPHWIYVQFRNTDPTSGFISEIRKDDTILDRIAPSSVQVAINDGDNYTSSRTISLRLSGLDANQPLKAYQLAFRDTAVANDLQEADWLSPVSFTDQAIPVLVPGTDDFRTLRVWARLIDQAGNISEPGLGSITLDTVAPTGGIIITGGSTITNSYLVDLALTINDDTPVQMLIANDSTADAIMWQNFASSLTWTLPPATQGTKQVCVKYKDAAGNESQEYCDDIEYDSIAPATPDFVVREGLYASASEIHLDLANGIDDVTRIEVAENPAFSNLSSYPPQASLTYSLSAMDGVKTIYVRYVDEAENASLPTLQTVILDTQAPSDLALIIPDNAQTGIAAKTSNENITLQLRASGASEMRLSATADCSGSDWQAYASNANLTLPGGDGDKPVSVRFRDLAGNTTACLSDQILLDRSAPVLGSPAITLSDPQIVVANNLVDAVSLRIDFAVSEAYQMKVSNQQGTPDATWQPYVAYIASWPVTASDGDKTVYVIFRDEAGNVSAESSATLNVNTRGNISGSVVIEGDGQISDIAFFLDGVSVTPVLTGNQFSIEDQLVDFYSALSLSMSGYDNATVTGIQVRPGETVNLGSVTMRLSRGNIDGFVAMGDGASAADVLVELGGTGYTTRTASNGYFNLSDVLVGSYDLTASKDGYSPQNANNVTVTTGITTTVSTESSPIMLPVLSGDFTVNGGELYTNLQDVTLNLDFSGATDYRVSESADLASSSVSWQSYGPGTDYAFTLGSDEGLHTIYVQYRDGNGPSSVLQSSITLDTIAPTAGSLVLADGASAVNVLNVSAALSSEDVNGIAEIAFSEDGNNFASPVSYHSPYAYPFTGAEGQKCLYVQYIDPAGNRSTAPIAQDCVDYDVTPPLGTLAVVAADGSAFANGVTNSSAVYVQATSAESVDMKISNKSTLADVPWQAFDANLQAWNLIGGDGERTVYLALRDAAGNVAKGISGMSAVVSVDSTPPPAPIFTLQEGGFTGSTTVNVDLSNWTAGDSLLFESSQQQGTVQEQAVADVLTFTLPDVQGTHFLSLRYKDPAGNISSAGQATIVLDSVAPSVVYFSVDGSGYTNSTSVNLTLEGSGASEMRFSNDGSTWSNWETFQTHRAAWDIDSSSEGSKSIFVQVRDEAQNLSSGLDSAQVTYDITSPAASLLLEEGRNPVNSLLITAEVQNADSDVAYMAVANASMDCANETYVAFDATFTQRLAQADANNTVYVCLRDRAGNTQLLSASVRHDGSAPVLTVSAAATTTDADGGVLVDVSVAGESTGSVTIEISSEHATSVSRSVDTSNSWTTAANIDLLPASGAYPDGTVLLTVTATDEAGNSSNVVRNVLVDRQDPSVMSMTTSPAGYTSSASIAIVSQADGASQMQLSNSNDFSAASWEVYTSQRNGWDLDSSSQGNKTVYMRVRDAAGNVSNTAQVSVVFDNVVPSGTSIVINSGDSSTNDRALSLVLTATDANGIEMLLGDESVPANGQWQSFSGSKVWLLPDGTQGTRKVCVAFRDLAGNRSADICDDILFDDQAPDAPTMTSANGTYTNSRNVSLSFGNWAQAATIELASDASFAAAQQHTAQSTLSFTLPDVDGPQSVYARYLDATGNISPVAQLNFVLDRVAPDAPVFDFVSGDYTKLSHTELRVSAMNASEMKISSNATCSAGSWVALSGQAYVDLPDPDGVKDVSLQVRDEAGNVSSCVNKQITLDRQAPVFSSMSLSNQQVVLDAAGTVVQAVNLRVDFSVSGASEMKVSNTLGCADVTWKPYATYIASFALADATDGTKTVYARFRDAAGNETAEVSQTFVVDTRGDISGTVAIEGTEGTPQDISFFLDGNPVTPTWSGNTFTIENQLVNFYSSLLLTMNKYDDASITGIQVNPSAAVDVGTISLNLSRGEVEGYVSLADGTTPQGVLIQLVNTGYTAQTNEAGYFFIGDVLVSTYDLKASKDGYSTQTRTSVIVSTGQVTTVAEAGAPISLPVLSGDFTVNGGVSYVASRTVTLNLSFTDAVSYRASEDSTFGGDSQAFTDFSACTDQGDHYDCSFNLSDSDATHAIFVQFTDSASAQSDTYQASVVLDRVAPTQGSVVLADGANAVNVLAVSAALSSSDSNGITQVAFSLDGTNFDSPVSYHSPYTYTFTGLEGQKCLYAQYIDPAGNRSALSAAGDCVDYDLTPPTGSIAIVDQNGVAYTGNTAPSSSVYLSLSGSDTVSASADLQMKVSNKSTLADVPWQSFDASLQAWNLLGGDGSRTVFLALKDEAGNVAVGTSGLNDSVTVDTTAPDAPIFSVDEGSYVNARAITLTLGNWTAGETVLFESSLQQGAIQETPAAASVNFTLPDVDGLHFINLRYRDAAGNESASSQGSVTLDRVLPTLNYFAVDDSDGYTNSSSVTLLVDASGASEMRFMNSTGSWSSWETYQTRRLSWALDTGSQGTKTIIAETRDLAGNVSTSASASIIYDSAVPTVVLALDGGATYTNQSTVLGELSSISGDVVEMSVGDNTLDCATASFSSVQTSFTHTLANANALNTIKVCVRDSAGNTGYDTESITHDNIAPQLAVTVPNSTTDSDGAVIATVSVTGESDPVSGTLSSPDALADVAFSVSTGTPVSPSIDLKPQSGGAADGAAILTISGQDLADNSTSINRIVTVDREAPVLDAFTCSTCTENSSLIVSDSSAVDLQVTASGATEMRFGGNITSSTDWQTFKALSSVSLSSTDGNKTVTVELRDAAGNLSAPSLLSLSIVLDQTYEDSAGDDQVQIIGTDKDGASQLYTRTSSVHIKTLGFSDAGGGLTHLMISESAAFVGASWMACQGGNCNTELPWTFSSGDGSKTVYAKVKDAVGHESSVVSNSIELDTQDPVLSLAILGTASNAAFAYEYTRSQNVSLEISAADGTGTGFSPATALMKVSENPDFSGADWENYSATRAFTLSAGEGLHHVYVKLRDLAGNESVAQSSISYDISAPSLGNVYFSEGLVSDDQNVTLNISAAGDASGMKLTVTGEGFNSPATGSWVPVASSVDAVLTDNGVTTVAVQLRDKAGNTSNTITVSILLDDADLSGTPNVGTVLLSGVDKDGYGYGKSVTRLSYTRVQLSSFSDNTGGSGLTDVMVSEDSNFVGASWQSCYYSTCQGQSFYLPLSSGDGSKNIFVKVRDAAGNESATVGPTAILVDTEAPSLSAEIQGTAETGYDTQYTRSNSVTLHVTGTDTGSGLSPTAGLMRMSNTSSFSGSWYSYGDKSQTLPIDTDGLKTIYVQLQDLAGNRTVTNTSIFLDTEAPRTPRVYIDDDDEFTGTTAGHTLSLSAADDGSGLLMMNISNSTSLQTWEDYSETKSSWSLTSGVGSKTVYAWFKDAAGNVSTRAQDRIVVDLTAPTGVSFTVSIDEHSGTCAADHNYVHNTYLPITLSGSDDLAIAEYKLAQDSNFGAAQWMTWPGDGQVVWMNIDADPGEHTISLKVRDHMEHETTAADVCVTLDTDPPMVAALEMYSNSSCTTPIATAPYLPSSSFYMKVNASAGAGGATLEQLLLDNNADLQRVHNGYTYYYNSETTSLYHYYNENTYPMSFDSCLLMNLDATVLGENTVSAKVKNSYDVWSSAGDLTFVLDTTAPSVPLLSYAGPGSHSIKAFWTAATDAESSVDIYRVYYATHATVTTSDDYVEVDPDQLSVALTDLDNHQEYWLNVTARNQAGLWSTMSAANEKKVVVGYKRVQVVSGDEMVMPVDVLSADGILYVLYLTVDGSGWDDAQTSVSLARSEDWGSTWTSKILDPDMIYARSDGDLAYSNGVLYALILGDTYAEEDGAGANEANDNDDLRIYKSIDKGLNWTTDLVKYDVAKTENGAALVDDGGALSAFYNNGNDVYRIGFGYDKTSGKDKWDSPQLVLSSWGGSHWKACANGPVTNFMVQSNSTTWKSRKLWNHETNLYSTDKSFTRNSASLKLDMACNSVSTGNVYAVGQNGNDLVMWRGYRDGYTWNAPVVLIADSSVDSAASPAIWVPDMSTTERVFVSYRDGNDGTVYLGKSDSPTNASNYSWVPVDESGQGGVFMVMNGQSSNVPLLAYTDVEGTKISLVTVPQPPPSVEPKASVGSSGLLWTPMLGTDRYQINYGASSSSLTSSLETPVNYYDWENSSEAPYCKVSSLDDLGMPSTDGHIYQVSGFTDNSVATGTNANMNSMHSTITVNGDYVNWLPPLRFGQAQTEYMHVYHSNDGGATVTRQNLAYGSATYPFKGQDLVQRSSRLHAVGVRDYGSSRDLLDYVRSTDNGETWSSSVYLSTAYYKINSVDVAVSENSAQLVVVVYTATDTSGNSYLALQCSQDYGANWTSYSASDTHWEPLTGDVPTKIEIAGLRQTTCTGAYIYLSYLREGGAYNLAKPCYRRSINGGSSWGSEVCNLGDDDSETGDSSIDPIASQSTTIVRSNRKYEYTYNVLLDMVYNTTDISGGSRLFYLSAGSGTVSKDYVRRLQIYPERIVSTDLAMAKDASGGTYVVFAANNDYFGLDRRSLKLGYCRNNCHSLDAWQFRTLKTQQNPAANDFTSLSIGIDATSRKLYIGYQMDTGTDALHLLYGGIMRQVD